jgi:hypothetical protein
MVLKWVITESQNLEALFTHFEATMDSTNMNISELNSLWARLDMDQVTWMPYVKNIIFYDTYL